MLARAGMFADDATAYCTGISHAPKINHFSALFSMNFVERSFQICIGFNFYAKDVLEKLTPT